MAQTTHYNRYSKNTRLSPGRTVMALRQIFKLAAALGLPELRRVCSEGMGLAEDVIKLSLRRRAQKSARGGGQAKAIDRKMDKLIRALCRRLEDIADSFADEPRGERAAELLATFFPDGYYAVTSLPYEDELAAVARIFQVFVEGDAAEDVEPLELGSLIEGIGRLLPAYQEALELRELVTAGDVRSARDAMHVASCAAVAFILFTFRRPEEEAQRAALLAPFDDQYARAAAARRQGLAAAAVAEGEDGAPVELDAEEEALDEALLLDEAVAGDGDVADDPVDEVAPE